MNLLTAAWAKLRRPSERISAEDSVAFADLMLERVDFTGQPAVEGFSPEHLLRRKDRLPKLFYPPAVPAVGLDLPDDELVLGIDLGEDTRVYPTSTLRGPHLVNDRIGDRPLLITFCPRCFSGLGFDPVVEGRTHTFIVYGGYQGSLVIQDDQTATVWAHTTGEALVGPLAGRRLEPLPTEMTTLKRWLELHPESLTPDPSVMVRPKRVVRKGLQGWQRRTISRWDNRLPAKTRVLGVTVDGRARAYVLNGDRPGPSLFQDDLEGVPVVLLGSLEVWPTAYDRRLGEKVVDLHLEGGRTLDGEGTTWDSRGRARDGPMAGHELVPLLSILTDWNAWYAYHPDTGVVQL